MVDEKIYALEELDAVLDALSPACLDQAAGLKVAYASDDEYEILETAVVGAARIGLRLVVVCARCGSQPETYYLCRENAGEWYALYDKTGVFVTDIRDATYHCDACTAALRAQAFVLIEIGPPPRRDHRPRRDYLN